MKKILKDVRSGLFVTTGVVLMAFLFSACKKSLDSNNSNIPLSALMGFNLAPDKPSIGISISGNSLTNAPLGYTSFTGTYLPVYPGSREIAAFDNNPSAPFATVTQNFEVNKYYSVFTIGANGSYKNVIVNDQLDSLSDTSGRAFVRYINAIPDSTKPAITITAGGTDVSNKNESFGTVSDFKSVSPGDVTVKVANGSTITATRTITLEKGKVYTLLFVGIPGSTDTEKLVQIKYITNGSVD